MEPTSLVADVREFLSGLRRDWPELFRPRREPPPARPAPASGGGHEALFHARAAHFAPQLGVTFGRVRVKSQKTLWGSCAPSGDLNFNWRLTLAPPEVLDYVVVHELAHRLEMNHSPRFWAHVARVCPEFKDRRRWLRRNSEALFRAEYA
ncbi:MAG: M48 family metallopeptidase [Elusimicrobiota bacterium]|nr:M48 family metallopeptidase [Elusimicrobiota bacterium]